MEPAAFQAWLAGGPAPQSPVAAGEKLFVSLNCITCHKRDSPGRGPVLDGLFGATVRLANGETITADEAYIRESILNPAAKVVAGYQPVMPPYQGQVDEEKLLDLISYIRTLDGRRPPPEPIPAPSARPPDRQGP